MRGSGFVFNYVQLLFYKCHETNLNHGGSNIDSSYWIKSKTAIINLSIKKTPNAFNML